MSVFSDIHSPLFFLEKAVANVERAIVKSLEKQYSDILTPLKDSIPQRLHLQVQKLARRQSATVQLVPSQVSSLDACMFIYFGCSYLFCVYILYYLMI